VPGSRQLPRVERAATPPHLNSIEHVADIAALSKQREQTGTAPRSTALHLADPAATPRDQLITLTRTIVDRTR